MTGIEELLGINPKSPPKARRSIAFSFLFFSDVRQDITNREKYEFTRDVTIFGDRSGFTAIYLPERHFFEYGSVFANSAVVASYLIPQTERIRFRTAGISLPLHHPAEVVEAWAINDVLSDGRIDLGFGSGWQLKDFIYSPGTYENRKEVCNDRIPLVQKLWRGDTVDFMGPKGEAIPIRVYPRPVQKELNVWLLMVQNDAAFVYAGQQGYNIFTMLSGLDIETMGKKFALYRQARQEAGFDPDTGIVTLMLHTFIHEDPAFVKNAIERPFKEYIKSFLDAHVESGLGTSKGVDDIGATEKEKMLEYAYHRYSTTAALFGTPAEARKIVERTIDAGVDEIACLVDFGVDYDKVKASFPHLKNLVSNYL